MSEKSLRERLRRSFKWNKSTHQTDQEDTPWIEETVLQLPGNENDRQGCLLDLFLDTLDRSPRLGYELPVFSRILNPAIFDQILSKGYDGSDKLAAWLHDQGAAGETREYNGPVSIATLDHILTLKRINEPRMKNAETRRIYIPNPSPTAIGILILRATKSLAPAFKSSIFHYLDMSTRIGLRLAPDEFTLEFHMPSFAWRSDAVFLQDTRSTVDHHPIRQSTELSFLSRTPQPIVSMDYLHEFQTSICLTGRSTSSWTAVCLVDSYFEETADPGNDYLMSEYDEADEGGHKSRNLAQRNVNSNRLSRLDPREYFLRIVKRRISRTKEEWINTSYKIQSSIHSGIYDSPIPVTPRSSSLGSANEEATLIENAEAWFRQTSRLLSRLIAVLSKSNDAWHKFVQRDLDLLNKEADHKTVVGIDGCLCCISDSIEEMETVLESMIQLERELENFQRKLSFHVAVDGGRAIKLQQWNVTILQFISPMALAGSIMQAGLVVGDAYVWFLFLTVLLTSLTLSLSWFVRKWESFTSPLLSPDPTLQLSSQEVRIREREPFQPVLDAATRLPSSPDPMAQQAVAELKLGGKRFSPMVSTESSTKLLWM